MSKMGNRPKKPSGNNWISSEMPPPRPIPWWEPKLAGRERENIDRVLESGYLNEGECATRFEEVLARRLGVGHAVACTSGTAALFLALKALGIGPGDEVVVPDVTFVATLNAVTLAGARVVLADVSPRCLTLSPESLERKISPRTRAVIPVHVSGRGADMEAILSLTRPRSIWVVEDAAEALLSRQGDRYLGTIGRLGCFSFSPNKTITTGQGGLVVTDDEGLCRRVRELKDQGRPVRGTGGADVHDSVGFNFKITDLQCAVGLAQLELLEDRASRLRRTYEQYRECISDGDLLRLPGFSPGEVPQWTDAVVADRDAFVKYLGTKRIGCRPFWFPAHRHAPYRTADEDFPVSTELAYRAVWLPSAFSLTDGEIRYVCEEIRNFIDGAQACKNLSG